MPALLASSDVVGVTMPLHSHNANYWASPSIRIVCDELTSIHTYNANMARKTSRSLPPRPAQPDWYLPEWMSTLRVKQAALARECGWSNSTMHGIYHGRTEYYREIVNLIARILRIEPYELLMHPDQAMAMRRMRESAFTIAADNQPDPPATPGITKHLPQVANG
jgi:hypothetical protein